MRCTKIARRGFNPQRNDVFITELVGHRTDLKGPGYIPRPAVRRDAQVVGGSRGRSKAGSAIDNYLIALPKLEKAYKNFEKAGFSTADIDKLKARTANMTAEQKREVAYQLHVHGATDKPDIPLRPNTVPTLTKPANFNTLSAERQNAFYAQQALSSEIRTIQK